MSNINIYGIKNCDTMKKAMTWLTDHGVDFEFHDYKKVGADQGVLEKAMMQCGWENVINRRGTTWRKLSEDLREGMDEEIALQAAIENPSLLKRPMLVVEGKVYLGFKPDQYAQIFKVA